MNPNVSKLPVKTEKTAHKPAERASAMQVWRPFESLRQEVDRLFEDFDRGFWRFPFGRSMLEVEPFWKREPSWGATPAVDIVEKDDAYEVKVDLPGIDEKAVEVKLTDDSLTIKGEQQEEKEEKKKDYYLRERHFGSFERSFALPEGVDRERIEAGFRKGVLTVTLPKKAEARKAARKIEVKGT